MSLFFISTFPDVALNGGGEFSIKMFLFGCRNLHRTIVSTTTGSAIEEEKYFDLLDLSLGLAVT